MTPLLLQFIAEARELLDKGSQGILRLEQNPGDAATIHEVFRALHTLKGSCGLFDPEFAPMTRLAHAGEDLLDGVRNGKLDFSRALTDHLLAAIDRLQGWVNDMEVAEHLPADAAEVSAALVAVLRQQGQETPLPEVAPPPVAASADAWWRELPPEVLARVADRLAAPDAVAVLVDYTPDPNCFFFGEDPLHLVSQVPGLLALSLAGGLPWPLAPDTDPFQCALRFLLASSAPRAEVAARFGYVENQVRLAEVTRGDLVPAAPPRDPALMAVCFDAVLAEQRAILRLPCDATGWGERGRAVGETVARLLRHRHPEQGTTWQTLCARAEREHTLEPLRAFLHALAAPVPVAEERAAPPVETKGSAPPTEHAPARVLKVDQARIDHLLALAGELVVAKNALPYLAQAAEREFGSRPLARRILDNHGVINRLVEELQATVMQVRMLPVGTVFQRFPRLVRDTSRKLDKQVRLEMAGEETEADKNVIELLAEPLIHLVRNSLDHGLETPAARQAAGKPGEGVIRLAASQESDRVVITIQDDGKGIDPGVIRRKAAEKGLLEPAAVAALSDHEAIQLIFAPGFSTAEQVSDLSGRGVGMDAVKSAVAAMGGSVILESVAGQGTTVRLELPMTMAVNRVMLVEQNGVHYGIPLEQVVETVRISRGEVHPMGDGEAVVLRDKVLPLLHLARLLQLDHPPEARGEMAVLVVRPSGMAELALVVESLDKGLDVVLKPLDGILAGIPGYGGAALLGNGKVLLVLNLKELLHAHSL